MVMKSCWNGLIKYVIVIRLMIIYKLFHQFLFWCASPNTYSSPKKTKYKSFSMNTDYDLIFLMNLIEYSVKGTSPLIFSAIFSLYTIKKHRHERKSTRRLAMFREVTLGWNASIWFGALYFPCDFSYYWSIASWIEFEV